MDTIFMNSENTKTSKPHVSILNHIDKIFKKKILKKVQDLKDIKDLRKGAKSIVL